MNLRAPSIITPLDVEEIDDIPFDFSRGMRVGETISDVEITAEYDQAPVLPAPVLLVDDPDAQDMVEGVHVVGTIDGDEFTVDASGPVVLQRFDATGRIPGAVYCLRCRATLSSGRQLVAAGHVAVKRL